MSEIVIELKNRNWKNERICRELGMEEDEVLRLLQITGLAEMFSDEDFSRSWDIEDSEPGTEWGELSDEINPKEKEKYGFRTVNTSDEDRIFHTYEKWECYKAGFYANSFDGMTNEECEIAYAEFLSDLNKFENALDHVIHEWKHSCEHYLTNKSMNRIAWLGQAAMCYATGIPSKYCGGYNLLTVEKQDMANIAALKYLNKWLEENGREQVELFDAMPVRQSTIY